MTKILILLFISCFALTASSQTDTGSLLQRNGLAYPVLNSVSANETMMVYQVLSLTNQNKEKSFMVIFCETPVTESKQRAKLKNDYMLRRERIYLAQVFFAKVEVVEKENIQTDTKTYFRLLEEKYAGLRLWAVLNTEMFLK